MTTANSGRRPNLARRRLVIVAAMLLAAVACAEKTPLATDAPAPVPPSSPTTSTSAATTTSTTTPPTTEAPAPRPVVVAVDGFQPFTFNPLHPDEGLPAALGEAYLGGAWMWGPDGEQLPMAVTELPTVDNGGVAVNDDGTMSVTYVIHPDAAWSDGTPISGDDFSFTFELITGNAELLPFGREAYDLTLDVTASDRVVTATLARPTIQYLDLFEWLVPRHAVEGTDPLEDWNDRPWPSAGPFVLTDVDGALGPGTRLTFAANEHYWLDGADGESLPRLDAVVFELQGDPELTEDGFASGEISAWDVPAWQPLLDFAEGHGTVEVAPSPIWEHFTFNFGSNNANAESLNTNLSYRRAIAYAIDREAIVAESSWGGREVLDSPFALYDLGARSWETYRHDSGLARELLATACAEVDRDCEAEPPRLVLSTTSNTDERPRVANLVVEQLQAIGIDAVFDPQDSFVFFGDVIDEGTFDLGLWAWVNLPGLGGALTTAGIYDPESPPRSRTEGLNYARYGTPEVTGAANELLNQPASLVRDETTTELASLLDALAATVDVVTFGDLLSQVEALLADQVVFIPLTARVQAVAYRDVAGVEGESGLPITWNIEEWHRP